MHLYKISTGNPEGFEAYYVYTHDYEFNQNEFVDMVEEIFAEAYEAQHKKDGCAYLDLGYVKQKMEEKGFKKIQYTAAYDFEPHCGKSLIRSQRLLKAIDLPDNYCTICEKYTSRDINTLERQKETCSMYNNKECYYAI